jgi:hypothetical protein
MARLLAKDPDFPVPEILLTPGRNILGREGANDFLVPHPSVSRQHCEVWLTPDALLVRDLSSRNGTFIDGARVEEGQVMTGQTLRLGDIEWLVAEAPVHISVPDLPLGAPPPPQTFMEDGTPCCLHHPGVAATLQCPKCQHVFCAACVRELKLARGVPRRFCPDCGGNCERLAPTVRVKKRGNWLEKIVDAFNKPSHRR